MIVGIFLIIGINFVTAQKHPRCGHGPPAYVDPERCCEFPEFESDDYYQQCVEELNIKPVSDYEDDEDLYEDSCVLECVFNKTGLHNLNEDNLVKMISDGTKDVPEWNTKAKQIVTECVGSITKDKIKEYEKLTMIELKHVGALDRQICDMRYEVFADCLYLKLFKDCPKDRFEPTKKCNGLLAHTHLCDDWI